MKNERLTKTIVVSILILLTLWFGVKPLISGNSFRDYAKMGNSNLDFGENEYATIVIGSEPEGIASALACARTGLKTLIVTGDNDLGSYIKKSRISQMIPRQGIIDGKKILLNQGIYQEIFGKFNVGFTSEDYEKTVNGLVAEEKNLDVIYSSFAQEVDLEGETLKGILVKQPDGKHFYKAQNFIDATRDGQLLILCGTPYFKGSEDLGIENFYSSPEFNFIISGVDFEALKKSQKTSDFGDEFQRALLAYEKITPRTKIVSPSFINQNENELVITGLKVFGVDVEDKEDLNSAFKEAEEEAGMLTAYLKSSLVAFKDCMYKGSPDEFFIPEYRHFEGRYRLKVSDILENKNFKDKIALCSEAIDAGKFMNDSNLDLIVTKPNVYSIPIGCILPLNLQNVIMTGYKASFSSLASTSAGSLPTSITVGEAAGLIAAYCFVNEMQPAGLFGLSDKELRVLTKYIERGGITLSDFSESILIPKTEMKLMDHWVYPYVKTLAEFGLIAGGEKNDYKLDYKASQELFSVLLKNAIVKMAPDFYSLDLDQALKPYEVKEVITGEISAEIILDTLDIGYDKGQALVTLKERKILPVDLADRINRDETLAMDEVYGLIIETVKNLNHS